MKKLVVFDWNGTLIADTKVCMDTDNHMLSAFGGRPVGLKTYRETIIIPSIDFYVRHGCKREDIQAYSEKFGMKFHEFYEKRASKCRTRRGANDLLNWLKSNSIPAIIVSNHLLSEIQSQLNRLKIEHLFTDVIANTHRSTSFVKARTKREKVQDYLAEHEIDPQDAFIIGDSPEEVEIGKSLGISTVAITNGYYSEARLTAANPDYFIHNLSDFLEIIRKS